MADTSDLLVIGARSLVGRRLRDLVPEATLTSRQTQAGKALQLDMTRPGDFEPDRSFSQVIICAPIWLVDEALLARLVALGMKRLVAFSSTSVFTKDESEEVAERDVVRRLRDGEVRIAAVCAAFGVSYTVLRPTLIYDEGLDDNVSRIASLILKLGFFPVCGAASGLRQPVHARDLARAAVQVLTCKATFNNSYNLPGGESLTYRDMVARIFAALGRQPLILSLPEWVWRWGFGVLGLIRPGRALKENLAMARRMNRDLWFDEGPAMRDFGYDPGIFKPQFSDQTASSLPDGSVK